MTTPSASPGWAAPADDQIEEQILRLCARTWSDPEEQAQLEALLSRSVDWSYLLGMAASNLILPLLHRHLRRIRLDSLGRATLGQLRRYTALNEERVRRKRAELARVLPSLNEQGIKAIPYIRSTLAFDVYERPEDRQAMALDILVPQQDVSRSVAALTSSGYRATAFGYPKIRGSRLKDECGVTLLGDEGWLHIYWESLPRGCRCGLGAGELWSDLKPLRLSGYDTFVLSPERLLVTACLHASSLYWQPLGMMSDLAELLRVQCGLSWPAVLCLAGRTGTKRVVHVSALLTAATLGLDLPRWVARSAHRDPVATSIVSFLSRDAPTARRATGIGGVMRMLSVQVKSRERVRDKAGYCLRLAAKQGARQCGRALRFLCIFPKSSVAARTEDDFPRWPTSMAVVGYMLGLADVTASDIVYDLGCGDGRIVIAAAKTCGCRGVGVDVDRGLIEDATRAARREGVEHLVRFLHEDAMSTDIAPATVVALFLGPELNLKLRPMLQCTLQIGARVVSHNWGMGDWRPSVTKLVCDEAGDPHLLHLWRISPQENRRDAGSGHG